MEIYDLQGNLLESYDETLGYLKEDVRVVHHDAVEGVPAQWHLEVTREFPNGGKEVRRVVDVPAVAAQAAWDEEIPILVYVPYTQEELDAIEAEKSKPTQAERIAALEAQNAMLTECLLEMSEMVYA